MFFEKTGYVWNEIVYDNMKNVVKKFLGKNGKELNENLIKLSLYYGFELNVTNAFRGNEKGHVENSVNHIRNRAFALKYKFNSLKSANLHLTHVLNLLIKNSKIDEEIKVLKPAPPKYEISTTHSAVVNKAGMFQLDRTFYSVPDYLAGHTVTVENYYNEICVYANNAFVCEHFKANIKDNHCLNILNYISTFKKKPGALKTSYVLKNNPELHRLFQKYY